MLRDDALEQIFLPTMNHPLRGHGLASAKRLLLNDDNVVAGLGEPVSNPQAGNTRSKDDNVVLLAHPS